jgi:hypothetical protein
MRRSPHRAGDRIANSNSSGSGRRARHSNLAGEDPDVAVAVSFSELDDLFFDWGRAGLLVGQHQLLRHGVVDSIGFDIKVVIVTDDKCHLVKSTSNEQSYKIFSLN